MGFSDQRALLGSIALHVLALFLLNTTWESNREWISRNSASIETRTLTEKEFKTIEKAAKTQRQAQIVQSDDLQSDPNLVAPLTQKIYQSKNTNVVDQNTRAARVGAFKNVKSEGIQEQSEGGRKPAGMVEEKATLVEKLFKVPLTPTLPKGENKLDRKTASIPKDGGEGFSATNDYLPDVSIGTNTLLNTQEFKYYGFYERIRQKLSFQWESRLKNTFETLIRQGVTQISGDRITKLRVHLQPDGSLLRTDVLGTSGYNELDRAALDAFRAAAPFPNPPKGLIGENHTLSIDWSFVVMTAEDAGIRLSVRRAPGGIE